MKLSVEGQLRRAVWGAFAVGAVINSGAAFAQDKDATQLQGVEVTGSRVRRVDTETSDAVQVLDRKQIQATGAATLGQLIQSIPSFGGTPFNSQVNNGGGTGQAFINLRGLGAGRTLILIDGQRVNDADVNSIPSNLIERVDILKEGAGAVYGTDAIGGVVNFITRKSFTGIEAQLTAGTTEQGDGQHGDVQLTWGSKVAGGNIVFGASFSREDEIRASDRPVSAGPQGLYYGNILPYAFSSSRSPQGAFSVGQAFYNAAPEAPGCDRTNDLVTLGAAAPQVTLIQGRTGTSVSDYRRFCNNLIGTGFTDRYNYQPENLALIPSKHLSLFGSASLPVSENVKWFGTGYFTQTRANSQLAAEPFDNTTITGVFPTTTPSIRISSQSIYNPFGRDITSFGKRSTDVGDRINYYTTDTYQFYTGFKGTVADRFNWDITANYGRQDQLNTNYGFLNFSNIFNQLGPSFIDASGTPRCGTAAAPIINCTPINVLGTTGNTLSSLGTLTNYNTYFDETDITANISGDLFKLPAGALGVAVGVNYRTLHYNNTPDALAQAFQLSENNSKATTGGYNVREAYAEAHIPILAGLPLVKSFDVNAGVRYSNYSSFGSQVSGKYAVEYRPYSDLLLRGTYSDTYRAPTTTELFQGAVQGAPTYTDPCNDRGVLGPNGRLIAGSAPDGRSDVDGSPLANHPTACANTTTGFRQNNSQGNSNSVGNADLQPEKGFATDFGLVFSPSFYKPLSIEADYYRYSLKSAINRVSLQTVIDGCFNNEASGYCGNAPDGQPYLQRDQTGQLALVQRPNFNSSAFDTKGIDLAIKLNYPKLAFGGYNFGRLALGFDANYLIDYTYTQFDPLTGVQTGQVSTAGQYESNVTGDTFPRVKLLGFAFWSLGNYGVSVQDRYIGEFREDGTSVNPDGTGHRLVGGANYVDISGTYTLRKINTDLTVGINDLFSDGAQQEYTSGLAGAANPIYDIRGRNFYGRITVRFK